MNQEERKCPLCNEVEYNCCCCIADLWDDIEEKDRLIKELKRRNGDLEELSQIGKILNKKK